MRARAIGRLAALALLLSVCRAAGAAEAISLAETNLRPGAVPLLRITTGAEARYVALYARTAGGAVYALPWLERGKGMQPFLEVGPGQTVDVRAGKGAGYFVAPRTGLESDREALILLTAPRPISGMGALAPAAGAAPDPGAAPGAGHFLRALAAAPWGGNVRIHFLAYRIGGQPRPEGEALRMTLGAGPDAPWTLLLLVDLLSVEVNVPARRILIADRPGSHELLLELADGSEREGFLRQLPPLLHDLGIPVVEIAFAAEDTSLRVEAAAP